MEDQLLSIAQAAKKMGVNRSRIYVWIKQERIIPVTEIVRYGKEGTKTREVFRIPESQCIIPKAHKPGPKHPDLPRLITPYLVRTKKRKPKPIKRQQRVDLP